MTTDTHDNTHPPIGFWLKATDRLLTRAFRDALDSEGLDRRTWMALNIVDGSVALPDRDGERFRRATRRLADRGWAARVDGSWQLTDAGRAVKDRASGPVEEIRTRVADAVTPEDLERTLASLEQIARALGWQEGMPLPRREHGRRGHDAAHRFDRHGHGSSRDEHGFSRDEHGSRHHGCGHDRGFDRHERDFDRYERGHDAPHRFDRGFDRDERGFDPRIHGGREHGRHAHRPCC
ncbi:MarR family winged helix-turn-helix transcriptional regulator [Microbacterium sp. gxy059]|uniref:MarR family winged helix-turn-helix transcriptional regulator n=1 Tax=Microbacterium sp. gxy059 TaxID=2957199 RepID=UPI003D98F1FA